MEPTESETERVDRQHSAGGLVVDGERVLLISTQGGRRWQLPKGHLEDGETPPQAAEREVFEETGVRGRIRHDLGAVEYYFRSRGGLRIHKRVDYFVLEFVEGDAANFDPTEVTEARWFSWDEGIERLTFANERELVEKARAKALRDR